MPIFLKKFRAHFCREQFAIVGQFRREVSGSVCNVSGIVRKYREIFPNIFPTRCFSRFLTRLPRKYMRAKISQHFPDDVLFKVSRHRARRYVTLKLMRTITVEVLVWASIHHRLTYMIFSWYAYIVVIFVLQSESVFVFCVTIWNCSVWGQDCT